MSDVSFIVVIVVCTVTCDSVAVNKIENTLSEVASSMGSMAVRTGPNNEWGMQTQVWLHLGM